jgi:hypothetical protein
MRTQPTLAAINILEIVVCFEDYITGINSLSSTYMYVWISINVEVIVFKVYLNNGRSAFKITKNIGETGKFL